MSICKIDSHSGKPGNCYNNTGDGTFAFAEAMNNLFISHDLGYVPNDQDGSVSLCRIKDGAFTDCKLTYNTSHLNHIVPQQIGAESQYSGSILRANICSVSLRNVSLYKLI